MKFEIATGEILDLNKEDELAVFETISNGIIDGTGIVRTSCHLLQGNIGPDIKIICDSFFSATPVSCDSIKIETNELVVKKIRRRVLGIDNRQWITIENEFNNCSCFVDKISDKNSLMPNLKYEYQMLPKGAEEWSSSEVAWLTMIFGRNIIATQNNNNESNIFLMRHKKFLRFLITKSENLKYAILNHDFIFFNTGGTVFIKEMGVFDESTKNILWEEIQDWLVVCDEIMVDCVKSTSAFLILTKTTTFDYIFNAVKSSNYSHFQHQCFDIFLSN